MRSTIVSYGMLWHVRHLFELRLTVLTSTTQFQGSSASIKSAHLSYRQLMSNTFHQQHVHFGCQKVLSCNWTSLNSWTSLWPKCFQQLAACQTGASPGNASPTWSRWCGRIYTHTLHAYFMYSMMTCDVYIIYLMYKCVYIYVYIYIFTYVSVCACVRVNVHNGENLLNQWMMTNDDQWCWMMNEPRYIGLESWNQWPF